MTCRGDRGKQDVGERRAASQKNCHGRMSRRPPLADPTQWTNGETWLPSPAWGAEGGSNSVSVEWRLRRQEVRHRPAQVSAPRAASPAGFLARRSLRAIFDVHEASAGRRAVAWRQQRASEMFVFDDQLHMDALEEHGRAGVFPAFAEGPTVRRPRFQAQTIPGAEDSSMSWANAWDVLNPQVGRGDQDSSIFHLMSFVTDILFQPRN